MNYKKFLHRGKRSWWSGTVTTLCGLRLPAREFTTVWFPIFHTRCPTCEAVHQIQGK